ncbi:ABC transporter ATP-binding protein [Putridiphycobacter roseus]|uniref:ABC transporter ATP-binding protein n=1 Tax=Putridiphycobacter roseus TaxID=2219161 RepID=A0A2W1MY99_9FLAO|nr:ABC transporter transmembrane domain-containing protein [Putridiphycobacter roseus]PZE16817.1 ABC transporter ATP-binding protein [Putridiphycobacter roseus]
MLGRNKKTEKIKLSPESYKQAKNFLSYLKPYRGIYTVGWIFLLLSSVTAMLFPLLMGQLLGKDNTNPALTSMPSLDLSSLNTNGIFILMFIVFTFQAIFSFFRVVIFSNVTEKTLKDIKTTTVKKLLHLPIDFFNRNKVGELTSRIATDINLLQETLNTTIAEFFRQFITIILGVGFILFASWQLALWMLAVVPFVAIVAVLFGRKVKQLSKKAQDASAKSNAILEETLMGIYNVKSFTNENYEYNRYEEKVNKVAKLSMKNGRLRGAFVSFIVFALFGAIVFIIWKAKGMVPTSISNEEFYAFVLYTIFVGASFASLPDLYAKIQKAIGASEYLMTLVHEEEEVDANKPALDDFSGNVAFNAVKFSYPSRPDVEVLKGVTFEVTHGQTIALVGSSGAGKTTISNLLLKYYPLSGGAITFDGNDISKFSSESIRSQIAIVPQEVILFSGSIRANIAYGNLNASNEEIEAAAKQANALSFILGFPEQFDTEVGDRGIQLSGGQKQRIAIARAVLKNPKLLILDEATSALDTESEKLVQDALEKLMKDRTSIVIAHRLSTIKNADTILVLENGQVKQKGKHEDLIADKTGMYYQLNNTQV